jgi:DNA-directed RNA polymerase subunit RPC12/RpoP
MIRCPFCGNKIFGQKHDGDKVHCIKCGKDFIYKADKKFERVE